jgi:hypothetical protein
MATTHQTDDLCSYSEKLKRSVGPGVYYLGTPAADCGETCNRDIPADPSLRFQSYGRMACPQGRAVDDGSELWGLNYKNTKCSTDEYLPGKYNGKGACGPAAKSNPRACAAPQESTRLSNPPCTLHSTGWNRWEPLCWNPQDRALVPFEWFTSYRIVVKDNHTPCLENPMDQSDFVPVAGRASIVPTTDDGHWANKSTCSSVTPVTYVGDTNFANFNTCAGIN